MCIVEQRRCTVVTRSFYLALRQWLLLLQDISLHLQRLLESNINSILVRNTCGLAYFGPRQCLVYRFVVCPNWDVGNFKLLWQYHLCQFLNIYVSVFLNFD